MCVSARARRSLVCSVMENAEMAVASAKVEERRREKLPGMRVLQGLEQIGAS